MNIIKIFSIFFILAFTGLGAQINIVANTSVAGQRFKIEIIENAEKYCITLKILKGFQLNKEYKDEMEIYIEEFLAIRDKSPRSDSLKSSK